MRSPARPGERGGRLAVHDPRRRLRPRRGHEPVRRLRLRHRGLDLRRHPRPLLLGHGARGRRVDDGARAAAGLRVAVVVQRRQVGERPAPEAAATTYSVRHGGGGRSSSCRRPAGCSSASPACCACAARGRCASAASAPTAASSSTARPGCSGCRRSTRSRWRATCAASSRASRRPRWPAEALKAQAVAARTYAMTTSKGGNGFDHYPDTRSQVYGGVAAETALDGRRRARHRRRGRHLRRRARRHLLLLHLGRPHGVRRALRAGHRAAAVAEVRERPLRRRVAQAPLGPVHVVDEDGGAQAVAASSRAGSGASTSPGAATRRGSSRPTWSARAAGRRSPAGRCARASGCSTAGRTSRPIKTRAASRAAAASRRVGGRDPSVRVSTAPTHRLSGTVLPASAGGVVFVQRRTARGRWRTVGETSTGAGGRYAFDTPRAGSLPGPLPRGHRSRGSTARLTLIRPRRAPDPG